MLLFVVLLVSIFLSAHASEIPEIPRLQNLAFDQLYTLLKTKAEPPLDGSLDRIADPDNPNVSLASKLLGDLIADPTTVRGLRRSYPIKGLIETGYGSPIGQGSSKNGIACCTASEGHNKEIQCYQTKTSTFAPDYMKISHGFSVISYGISSDDRYLYALLKSEDYGRENFFFSLNNRQTKEIRTVSFLNSHENDASNRTISYNSATQQFLLFFPQPSPELKSSIFVFCSFNADQPTIKYVNNAVFKTINLNKDYSPIWQFIGDSIIAASADQYFLYEESSNTIIPLKYDAKSQRGSYQQDNKTKMTPHFITLKAKINDGYSKVNISYPLPSGIVFTHQAILNQKISMIQPSMIQPFLAMTISTRLFFDPLNFRYIESTYDIPSKTSTIYIYNMFSEQLTEALIAIDRKWLMATKSKTRDTNFCLDAWYIYHAEKCSDLFLDLEKGTEIVTKISPELTEIYPIYPLLTDSQKEAMLKKRSPELKEIYSLLTDTQKATILKKHLLEHEEIDALLTPEQRNAIFKHRQQINTRKAQASLSSSWKPVSLSGLVNGIKQNIGSFYYGNKDILIGGVMTWSILGAWFLVGRYLYRRYR